MASQLPKVSENGHKKDPVFLFGRTPSSTPPHLTKKKPTYEVGFDLIFFNNIVVQLLPMRASPF
jgi:hypothetical protein